MLSAISASSRPSASMPSMSVAVTSALTGPSTNEQISRNVSTKFRPDFATSDGIRRHAVDKPCRSQRFDLADIGRIDEEFHGVLDLLVPIVRTIANAPLRGRTEIANTPVEGETVGVVVPRPLKGPLDYACRRVCALSAATSSWFRWAAAATAPRHRLGPGRRHVRTPRAEGNRARLRCPAAQ